MAYRAQEKPDPGREKGNQKMEMELSLRGIEEREAWQKTGIALPSYPIPQITRRTAENPVWVHFGSGNIFRSFLGKIADALISEGAMAAGLTCVETFDFEIIDRIYQPHDNLAINVILHPDGRQEKRILGCFAEAIKADGAHRDRMKEIFRAPSLQLASFTITEKGYALRDAEGQLFPAAAEDMDKGPEQARTAMGIAAAMLYARFEKNGMPIAFVSMDNRSQNGRYLKEAILEMAEAWYANGLVPGAFIRYLEEQVSFPWTMIDKITPRPLPEIAAALREIRDIAPFVTAKNTFIAPYVNAEDPQYLVVEDDFPNGRPPLEQAGVFFTDRETVNLCERMKVTACLNPIHTALCTYDCMLGYELFADGMKDPELSQLAHRIGYLEGLLFVADPGILSPRAFLDEVIQERFPNPFLGDTSQRIATDISQMVGIRFGETIRACAGKNGTAESLTGIALAIAGWLRYLMALDDEGRPMALAPDPMIPQLQEKLGSIRFGAPESLRSEDSAGNPLHSLLSNERIFGINLYEAGIAGKIETMFRKEIGGPGAVRQTLQEYLAE